MTVLIIYILIFFAAMIIYSQIKRFTTSTKDFTSLKTVTFGDESAVTANRTASIISVLSIFFLWGAFTGSSLTLIHAPGPYVGDTSFTYTAENADKQTDTATVHIRVHKLNDTVEKPEIPTSGNDGFAKDDVMKVAAWRTSNPTKVQNNDEGGKIDGYRVINNATCGH